MYFSDDITWCASDCICKDCRRHPSNMQEKCGLHSYAEFKGTRDCPLNYVEVTTEERGWAGHFIGSRHCLFRRNTLVICDDIKYIVSTVGAYIVPIVSENNIPEPLDSCNYYETKVFESQYDLYDDIDVSKEINFTSEWTLSANSWDELCKNTNNMPDAYANKMHEKVVSEVKDIIKKDYIERKTNNYMPS